MEKDNTAYRIVDCKRMETTEEKTKMSNTLQKQLARSRKAAKVANVISNATPATIAAKATALVTAPTLGVVATVDKGAKLTLESYYGELTAKANVTETWAACASVSQLFRERKAGPAWLLCCLLAIAHKLLALPGYGSAQVRHGFACVIPGFLFKNDGSMCVQANALGYDFYTLDGCKLALTDSNRHARRSDYVRALTATTPAMLTGLLSGVVQPCMAQYLKGATADNAGKFATFGKLVTDATVRAELATMQAMKDGASYSL